MGTELAVIDAETGELVQPPATLFGTDDPRESLARAKQHADVLAEVIQQRSLFRVIGGKAYVYVDAWTLLGSRLGVFPVLDGEVEPVEVEGVAGFRATVKAVTRAGEVVGRATAYCMRDEPTWKGRPIHALAGMAETRATSRALRKPLGFIVQLAGYQPTGAEEMPSAAGEGGRADLPPSANDGAALEPRPEAAVTSPATGAATEAGVTPRDSSRVAPQTEGGSRAFGFPATDVTPGEEDLPEPLRTTPTDPMPDNQRGFLFRLRDERGMDDDTMKELIYAACGVTSRADLKRLHFQAAKKALTEWEPPDPEDEPQRALIDTIPEDVRARTRRAMETGE